VDLLLLGGLDVVVQEVLGQRYIVGILGNIHPPLGEQRTEVDGVISLAPLIVHSRFRSDVIIIRVILLRLGGGTGFLIVIVVNGFGDPRPELLIIIQEVVIVGQGFGFRFGF